MSQTPPDCQGLVGARHRPKPMKLIGVYDDGSMAWKCPRKKCQFVWHERTPVSLDNHPDTEKKGCQKSSPECSPRTYKPYSDV